MNLSLAIAINITEDNQTFPWDVDGLVYHAINIKAPKPTKMIEDEDIMAKDVVLKLTILAIIIVLGVFGNVIVIYTILTNKRLHRPPFYYLISLSVSDLSRAIFCMPFVLASSAQGSIWHHGDSACTILAFANTFFVFSSAVSLMSIAVDRHLEVVYSHFHRRRSHGLFNMIIVVLGWLISFAVSFPPVFGMGTYQYIPEESQCAFRHNRYRRNDTLGFVLVFSGVLFATFFLYARIFVFLRDHRRMRPLERMPPRSNNWTFFGPGANGQVVINWLTGMPAGPPPQMPTITQNLNLTTGQIVNLRSRRKQHLTRVFFILSVFYSVLWIPYLIQAYISIFGNKELILKTFVTIGAWMTYLQIGICPFVYMICNGHLRRDSRLSKSTNCNREFIPLE